MPENIQTQFSTFEEFWPHYLAEHSKPATRLMHVIGTLIGIASALIALASGHFGLLLIALVCGYGFAWVAHTFIEKNRPATFTHPLWSLRADFHMMFLWLTGQLESELAKHRIMT